MPDERFNADLQHTDSDAAGPPWRNALNRRVFQSGEFADGNGPSRRYVYDDWQMLCEYCEDNHSPHGNEMLLSEYVYGEYMDEVWLRDRRVWNGTAYETERLYFLHDPLYSVSGVMDAAGNLTEAYEYDPYGKRTVITDGPDADTKVNFTADDIRQTASPRNIRAAYTGQRRDDITGLYYYKNRYYSADLGRFLSRDPIGYADGLSLYQYAGSSPFSAVDTYGLWSSNIHKDLTKQYAVLWGYSGESSNTVSDACNGVDYDRRRSPLPFLGQQQYHFDGNNGRGDMPDTRQILYDTHKKKAIDFCCKHKNKGKHAAKELGIAIHPKQDISAHGHYGYRTMGQIAVIHNSLSPQKDYGDPGGYPDRIDLDVQKSPDGIPTKEYLHSVDI